MFANTLKENRELQLLLRNPVVEPHQKHQIFESIFNGTLHDTTYQFLDVLLRKKREPALDTICVEFFKLYNTAHNIKPVTITTAQPLSDALKSKIVAMLTEQTRASVALQEVVNPEIIGGYILEYDTYRLDASIQNQLRTILAQLCK